jgi:RimJ/RimL family protein N-acetyltransferase
MFEKSKIETRRLVMQPLKETDIDNISRIYNDLEVMKYRVFNQAASREETQLMLEKYCQHWDKYGFGRWAIIYKITQNLIGHCGLEFIENTVGENLEKNQDSKNDIEINYLIERDYWGMGLGSEAAIAILKYGFNTLKLNRIFAITKPENIASRRVMEKIGMQYKDNIQLYGMEWMRYIT